MRIIIEDSQTTTPAQASPEADGGSPAGQLLAALGEASTGQSASQAGGLQDAGPPPGWLVEAVRKAFEQEPGRFDAEALAQKEGDGAGNASDGGGGPDVNND